MFKQYAFHQSPWNVGYAKEKEEEEWKADLFLEKETGSLLGFMLVLCCRRHHAGTDGSPSSS